MKSIAAFVLLASSIVVHAAPLSISLAGAPAHTQDALLSSLTVYTQDVKGFSETQIQNLILKSRTELQSALVPLGYYAAQVTYTRHNNRIHYQITLGEPVRVRQLNLQLTGPAQHDNTVSDVFDHFTLAVGERLQDSLYETGKKQALATLTNQGYLDAHYATHTVQVDKIAKAADITLILDTGPQYTISDIQFSPTPLSQRLLHRYLPFKVGSPLKARQMNKLHSDLANSHYFKTVQVYSSPDDDDAPTKTVHVETQMNRPNHYEVGVGYGTDTDIRGKASYERRYLNSNGHHLGASIGFSGLKNRYEATYTLPGKHPATDNYKVQAAFTNESLEGGKSSNYREWIVAQNKALGDWSRKLELKYYREAFKEFKGGEVEVDKFLLPSAYWSKTIASHAINPANGYKIAMGLKGALDPAFSETTFVQGTLLGKHIYTLPYQQRLITKAELGATFPDKIDELPLGLRFFTGGDFSIRGYDYKSVGPTKRSPSGEKVVVGGRYLALLSTEIQQPLYRKISLAGFFDMGNAMNDWHSGYKSGTGVGLRWASPIGPVRFDVAKPLDRHNGWRLHVNLGADL